MRLFVRRVRAVARKEVAHVRRDPGMLALSLGMPLLLVCIFGFGVRFDADHLPVVLVDQDLFRFPQIWAAAGHPTLHHLDLSLIHI